jgi:hypothetical protein
VKIGVIVSVSGFAEDSSVAPSASTTIGAMASRRLDILGKSLLDRTLDKFQQLGAEHCSIVSHEDLDRRVLPSIPTSLVPSWQQALAGYVQNGVELLLIVHLNSYIDLNYSEFLQFHREAGAPLTHAYGDDGALDVTLVEASHLRNLDLQAFDLQNLDGHHRASVPQQRQFRYRGYINRLATPRDWYSLVDDGLHGRCGLTPSGRRVGEHIWQADDCELDPTVRITGPAFIGAATRVAACCVIAPGTSIERDCEIDCGTTVQQSWIQQNTYVGVALDVRRSLVSNRLLFNLERNVRVDIGEARLLGAATRSTSFLEGMGSFVWNSGPK